MPALRWALVVKKLLKIDLGLTAFQSKDKMPMNKSAINKSQSEKVVNRLTQF